MGFFDQFHKNGTSALKPQQNSVRREVSKTKGTPSPAPSNGDSARKRPLPTRNVTHSNGRSATSSVEPPARVGPKKQLSVRRRKPAAPTQRLISSSEDDDDGDDVDSLDLAHKRVKTGALRREDEKVGDPRRRVRSIQAFSKDEAGQAMSALVHAADIASLEPLGNFTPAFEGSNQTDGGKAAAADVELQYPSCSPRERFQLVKPRETDDFAPLQDIARVAELVGASYLTPEQARVITDEGKGILRKLRRAIARKSESEFREAVEEYNGAIVGLRDDGSIAVNLDKKHSLPLQLVEHILTQTYARTVSLKVDSLRKYENGTDNVYGELLPRFSSMIFSDTELKSDDVFVDLGSGVGNVVLQAALQVGCESWGCEVMGNACDLASRQETEFAARCRLWGLSAGSVHLERGDFLKNAAIGRVLARADVVLVNNQAFTPALNQSLINLFLDLKDGCRVVSLKSFVPADHRITSRNFNSPVNLLEVQTKNYYSNCVSWTNAPGTYCVAVKDSGRLKKFAREMGLG
ncbi:MAG: Nucleosomal histone H3-Lys79 methylase [Thelocarpon impressellum]|nr:MAG: Nucleosomal histone H3-Lys79 methylase [Thelocarpon impressellum]